MAEPQFIFAEVSCRPDRNLVAQGWENLVRITFLCDRVFPCEGYHPMSELLRIITDWRIGSEQGHPEQTPIQVSFSISTRKIVAMYSIERMELKALAKMLEDTRVCEGAFPIKVYGIDKYQSMFS